MINLNRAEIEALIDLPAAAAAIEHAYRATSRGEVNQPPVGHITFADRAADCHIKYGHFRNAANFVIKVATGFPQNAQAGLQTGNGAVLVLSALNGQLEAVLHDEMMLTDIRTGLGGAIASRHLARKDSQQALIIGTGPQARRQLEAHAALLPQRMSFAIWGRNPERVQTLIGAAPRGTDVTTANDLETAVRRADIIVTATGAQTPLVMSDWVTPGTHITAVGADAPGKQELDPVLVSRADLLAVDLASQCLDHGEVSHAARAGSVAPDRLTELGALLEGTALGRRSPEQLTIADLTGVAALDIAMANAVLAAWRSKTL